MATLRLTQDFKEFLSLLNQNGIEYLLIGGYAVCVYGHVRPTKDLDVWVATDPANLSRLREVLHNFGFSRTLLRMGVPPNRLQVLSEIAGVTFADCFARRSIMELDGIKVPVINLDDLKRNKSSTGRAGDLADVQKLEKLARQ
jgi:predicted nucleotidyltransferase